VPQKSSLSVTTKSRLYFLKVPGTYLGYVLESSGPTNVSVNAQDLASDEAQRGSATETLLNSKSQGALPPCNEVSGQRLRVYWCPGGDSASLRSAEETCRIFWFKSPPGHLHCHKERFWNHVLFRTLWGFTVTIILRPL
jgi:hypothetical protein